VTVANGFCISTLSQAKRLFSKGETDIAVVTLERFEKEVGPVKTEAPVTSLREIDDEILQRLAALPSLEYDRQRKKEAEWLGCRTSTLDELVESRRPKRPVDSASVAKWFAEKFPQLPAEFGQAVLEEPDKEGRQIVCDICQPFLAATLGEQGTPEAPTVYLPAENRFWAYSRDEGVFIETRDAALLTRLSRLLLEASRACSGTVTKRLEFGFRDSVNLVGIVKHAQGLLAKPHDFFDHRLAEFIPCRNGMLRLGDKKLLGFSPSYRRRNKLGVAFDAAKKCPLFLETLMRPALDGNELDLLQRWCGVALVGENTAQRILLLTGTAGGGKGTFIRVLLGIIGARNVGALRTQLLGERFELGRFLGKNLLWRGRAGQFFEPSRCLYFEGANWRRSSDTRIQEQQRSARHRMPLQYCCHLQLAAGGPLGRRYRRMAATARNHRVPEAETEKDYRRLKRANSNA
jgi:hypothetical protein